MTVTPWPLVPLRELVKVSGSPERVAPDKSYRLLGVRLAGNGAFLREEKLGSQQSAATLTRVSAGDFIYSRLFAWRGAFGLVPADLEGCYVSNEFPTFRVDDRCLDVRYLELYFARPPVWSEVESYCTGSTPASRNRFKEVFFLGMTIPLPPLSEQRRIVARVEALAAKVEEARGLRGDATKQANLLLRAMAHRRDVSEDDKRTMGWRPVALREVVERVEDPVRVDPTAAYPNIGILSFARGVFEKAPIEGATTSAKVLYRVHAHQFIYSRLFAFEGAYAVVEPRFDGHFVSSEFPTFNCDDSTVMPEFLAAYFLEPDVWSSISAGSKGLGDRRQRVQPEHVLNHELWLPPLDWQRRVAAVYLYVQKAKSIRSSTESEIDALLPAIYNQAFQGKL